MKSSVSELGLTVIKKNTFSLLWTPIFANYSSVPAAAPLQLYFLSRTQRSFFRLNVLSLDILLHSIPLIFHNPLYQNLVVFSHFDDHECSCFEYKRILTVDVQVTALIYSESPLKRLALRTNGYCLHCMQKSCDCFSIHFQYNSRSQKKNMNLITYNKATSQVIHPLFTCAGHQHFFS